MWELEPELLNEVCSHKFRQKEDVSQYVLREYQKLTGGFVPGNVRRLCRYYDVSNDNSRIVADIGHQKSGSVCLNDSNQEIDFEWAKEELKKLGFTYLDSGSNFIFAKHPEYDAKELFEALKAHDIYVRFWGSERIEQYMRISIGTREEMEQLFAFLKEYMWRGSEQLQK